MTDEAQTNGQSSSPGASQQSQTNGSAQGTTSQSNQQTSPSGQNKESQSQAPSRPAYVPESFFDTASGKVKEKEFSEHLAAITARVAADDVRRNSLPQKADDYKVELPADFKPPEGIKFEFRADDPLLAQARTMAHELGIPQEGFSKLLGLYAGSQVASQQQIVNARNAEVAKLGANGPARVTAVTTFFKSFLGEAEGAQLASRMFTARDIEIAEKLITKVSSQGGAQFRANGREPPEQDGRLSEEQISKLSQAERLNYSRRFDQGKMPAWKDPRAA